MSSDGMTTMHAADDDLVLDFYGELDPGSRERVRSHLATCDRCRQADQELRATLRLVDVAPAMEAPDGFEAAMWARVAPHLVAGSGPSQSHGRWQARALWAGAMAAALVAAFLFGRAGRPVSQPDTLARTADAGAFRERLLRAEVEDHLERSQRVLTELVNADVAAPDAWAGDRARAADLVADSRLYRRSAESVGDAQVSELLDDLERVLLDVANGPDDATHAELQGLRERIDQQDLLFRLRVVSGGLRRGDARVQAVW